MSVIVGRQEQRHKCDGIGGYMGNGPGGALHAATFNSGLEWLDEGTVVECQCGKTWVAVYVRGSGWMSAFYRREKRREKRKRLRAAACRTSTESGEP